MTDVIESTGTRGGAVLKSGIAAAVVGVALVIYGAYGDPHTKSSQTSAVPFLSVVVVVAAALVFGLVVPRGLRAERASRWALVPGIVSIVLFPLGFWSGVPLVLGGAAALLGSQPKDRSGDRVSTAAVVLGGIVVLGSLVVTILGNTIWSSS